MSEREDYIRLVTAAQEYISQRYAAALSDGEKRGQLSAYLDRFLRSFPSLPGGMTRAGLSERILAELVGYSVLTPYLEDDGIEEININAWDDIAVTRNDGQIIKLREGFLSPEQAVDIIRRLLRSSGTVVDNATPVAQGHLPNNTRVTAIKAPVVDEETGIAASIRLLHPSHITLPLLEDCGTASREMLVFLRLCLRYGLSFVIAGATSSGKTTLLNALLHGVPDEKRVFTIESGARELSLVRRRDGQRVNNVVHTISRPSEVRMSSITQEDLVVAALRFSPDIIVVGEMRDTEAFSAVEASLTGHTVVSTIHASDAAGTHLRLALLCQKRFPIDFNASLMQAAQAFPLVVSACRLPDHSRRVTDISECTVTEDGRRTYRTLFRFVREGENGGRFERLSGVSQELLSRFSAHGMPMRDLAWLEGVLPSQDYFGVNFVYE